MQILAAVAGVVIYLTGTHLFGGALRIMPLGDSITDGFSVPGGYRAPLYRLLTQAGYAVDFLGTQKNNSVATLGDPDHEGHSGYRIDQVAAFLPAWLDAVDEPDVILLLLGTNDFGQNHDPSHAINRLDQLIGQVASLRPTARIIVANLLPRFDNPSADDAIQREFNPFVNDVVNRHAEKRERVFFLDMRSALGRDDLADGLHPDQKGYEKMATNWLGMIARVVARERAGQFTINFDGASPDGSLNHVPIPATYQPVPVLTIYYRNVGIFNQGPDHTTGKASGGHYNTFSFDGAAPQSFSFNRAISLASVCLATYAGAPGSKAEVQVAAFGDADGRQPLTNLAVTVPAHAFGGQYQWVETDGLKSYGARIMRVDFYSDGNAQVDDMNIGLATNTGPATALRLKLDVSELHENGTAQVSAMADYAYEANVNVTAGARTSFASSDTNVLTISNSGRVTGVRAGRAVVSVQFAGVSGELPVAVLPGALIDFNNGLEDMPNHTRLSADYQPVPGLTIGAENVALFNGGPDHTTSLVGESRFNTYQLIDGQPQVFTFSKPVSVPSLWMTAFTGGGDPVSLKAYADEQGAHPLGVVQAPTPTFPGAGSYLWSRCTNLDAAAYDGKIRRLEIFSASGVNVNLDDMTVVVSTNSGALRALNLNLSREPLYPGMKVAATVFGEFVNFGATEVTAGCGVSYATSGRTVVAVDTNGVLTALTPGRVMITATLGAQSSRREVIVLPGHVVDFDLTGKPARSMTAIPGDYQPVPGLFISYENIGVFNGGPDHTTGKIGGNNFNTYQYTDGRPQVFKFSFPVSIRTMSLATYGGSDAQITVSAYADPAGTDLIGSIFASPTTSKGHGHYAWTPCINLDSPAFHGKIRRLEISGTDNANLDDLVIEVSTNCGRLGDVSLKLPTHDFIPGMSRQATVVANFERALNCDVSRLQGTRYRSSDERVVTVTSDGLVRAVATGKAQLTATYLGREQSFPITVQPADGVLVCFDGLSAFGNKVQMPSSYQPVPGLTLDYANVGIYNEGPDHTAGVVGGGNYNTYQFHDGTPQVFAFSRPVSLPMLWLSTYWGSGDQVTISAYGDQEGKNLLGTLFVSTPTFPGPGNYRWVECTNLNTSVYNEKIRRLELLGNTGNVQLDDLLVR